MGKKAVFSIKSPFGLFGIFSAAGFPFHYGNETDDAQLPLPYRGAAGPLPHVLWIAYSPDSLKTK